jgi:rsbT co-antagonist protein RsbR
LPQEGRLELHVRRDVVKRVRSHADLTEAVRGMLRVLRAAEDGDFSKRVDVRFEEDDPMGALSRGVNEALSDLARARQETIDAQSAIEQQIATILRQREVIRELSTPVIEVWTGVLCVPIVGMFDSAQAAETAESLLRALFEKGSVLAIIDLTGLDVMDTQTADHFLRMARAVRTLGVDCVITGVSPNVAQTMVAIGVELVGIRAFRSLRDALRSHVAGLSEAPAYASHAGRAYAPSSEA